MSDSSARTTPLLRHRWSHRGALHRSAVKAYNRASAAVPFAIKYAAGSRVRRSKLPYSLLGPDTVAVQVGAPRDTLRAGRSRGMYFALMSGRAVVIEPDSASAQEFEMSLQAEKITGTTVFNSGAWSSDTTLELLVDPQHPATNFTAGEVDYSEQEMARFERVSMPVRTIDAMLASAGIDEVTCLSLTTNGGELDMLHGASRSLRNAQYVCLRKDADAAVEFLIASGFEFVSYDDRGACYRNATSR